MSRLNSRQLSVPGGFKFMIPRLQWQPPPNQSFEQVVQGAIAALQANPQVANLLKWDLSHDAMANRVDEFNAHVCEMNGWAKFIQAQGGGSSVPKPQPPNQSLVTSLRNAAVASRQLIAGAKSLIEWDDSGEPAVAPELSEHRAIVCTQCPKNEPGDFTQWFTVPAAEIIKRRVQRAQDRKLTTPRDAQLHLCTACHCPLKLKVHVPIAWIVKRLDPQQIEQLKQGKDCWILNERERM